MECSAYEKAHFCLRGNMVGMASPGCCGGSVVVMVVLSGVTIQHVLCGFALTGSIRTWRSRPLGGANPSVAPVGRDILQHKLKILIALLTFLEHFQSV